MLDAAAARLPAAVAVAQPVAAAAVVPAGAARRPVDQAAAAAVSAAAAAFATAAVAAAVAARLASVWFPNVRKQWDSSAAHVGWAWWSKPPAFLGVILLMLFCQLVLELYGRGFADGGERYQRDAADLGLGDLGDASSYATLDAPRDFMACGGAGSAMASLSRLPEEARIEPAFAVLHPSTATAAPASAAGRASRPQPPALPRGIGDPQSPWYSSKAISYRTTAPRIPELLDRPAIEFLQVVYRRPCSSATRQRGPGHRCLQI